MPKQVPGLLAQRGRTPEQMPSLLTRLDDPYGIIWRVSNLLRRFSLTRTLRFAAGYMRRLHYSRPIFIIGMPRSGTTFLFYLLRASSQLGSLPREGHDIWRMYHHPRYAGWDSDYVGPGQVRFGERRFVKAFLYAYCGTQRFVEKTGDNCVRLPYLLDLFPDALFVVMKRNPCDVINSYINMWRHPQGRFRSYFVPQDLAIPGYPHRRQWCFTLIKGWRDFVDAPIPEIAFAQWSQYVEIITAARTQIPPTRWLELYFEDLLQHPDETTAALYQNLQLDPEPGMHARLEELLANPVNALTPPGQDKWRSQNAEEIQALLPRIAPLAQKLGYHIDPATGSIDYPTPQARINAGETLHD